MNLKNAIFVHRGKYSIKDIENNLSSFKHCVDLHKNIELDLHILRDNTVVVFHDKNLKRMNKIDVDIKNLTYNELCSFTNQDEKIPTLSEVLEIVDRKVLLDIEFKYDVLDGRLEKYALDILSKYKGDYVVKSFHPLIVFRLKKIICKKKMNVKVGLLTKNAFILFFSLLFIHPDFISINYKYLDKCFFRFVSKRKDTLLYTIKTKEVYEKYKDKGYGLILENFEDIIK